MAELRITIPDAFAPRVLQAVSEMQGYQAEVPDPAGGTGMVPNPESRQVFVRKAAGRWLKDQTLIYERRLAEQAAGEAKSAELEGLELG